ncbi:hypothetical protein AHAS_Ahas13G0321600 [Arachis hypogaea]|uniref:Uncharacterized protein n=1 Tax=Arachis hypogaea TaxID=3818 RepID=A0A444ZZU6_ARAHY|nr:hypothetical protein Ahy_B03g064572 isoform B [Arachis hypogaea]
MENTLKPGDIIQCRECGYCILYKKRTHRSKHPFFYHLLKVAVFIYLIHLYVYLFICCDYSCSV